MKDYICGVRQRRREMFVPLTHPPGHAQVDFGEALAVIGGVERKIHFLAMSLGPTEFQDPSSNCLIRDVETTLGKQVLNVPIAQRETAIEPDGMLDDDRWKAVTTVGYLAHPETLKHRPCRSHAVNVTMPRHGPRR